MGQQTKQREIISAIRFGYYGSRKLAAQGRYDIAADYRAAARRRIADLRALRALRAGGDA